MTPQQAKNLVGHGHSSPQPEAGRPDITVDEAILEIRAWRNEVDRLRTEIDRLRTALRAVRACTDPQWQAQLISEALRETKP